MYIITTHNSPDWDAIGSAYLLERYWFEVNCMINFVPAGTTDNDSDSVVDTGKELDEFYLRFDHHQSNIKTSATELVFEFLIRKNKDVEHLRGIVNLINDCDLGIDDVKTKTSRLYGIHGLLSSYKKERKTDREIYEYGYNILYGLDEYNKNIHRNKMELSEHIYYENNNFCVIRNGGSGLTFAAYDEGYDLVLFINDIPVELNDGNITYSIGIMRKEGSSFNLVDLYKKIYEESTNTLRIELEHWFVHPAGFFIGRGTNKSPNSKPIDMDILDDLIYLVLSN